MAGSAKFHDGEAVKYASVAENRIAQMRGMAMDPSARTSLAGEAQAAAMLAVAHRTAEQTAVLAELLGDDSHLDGLKVTLRDISDGFAAGQP